LNRLPYNIFIQLYSFIIRVVSPFNPKAKQWVAGRDDIFKKLRSVIPGGSVIWMHCSSLGEFEQGRPLLEKLRTEVPHLQILLTFFSPSGFEVQKHYEKADYIFYLPLDSPANAKDFFDIVNPKLVLFVKYDFWYYYLAEAAKRKIPLLLISGIFRKDQPFFKWYGSLYREMLTFFTRFFVQNDASAHLLGTIGIKGNVSISGDTRFDRVIEIAENFQEIAAIRDFCADARVIVAGSTWDEDDEELDHFANTNQQIKFIIAPHDIDKERLQVCRKLYRHSILFSELSNGSVPGNINTIIIDNIGMLSRLYKYATICYVGGGFGDDGVHNVLEAAVYGKPVVFGPEYEKFFEAAELIECGGAFSIDSALELEKLLSHLLQKQNALDEAGEAALNYVYSRKGATEGVMKYIQEKRLLTN